MNTPNNAAALERLEQKWRDEAKEPRFPDENDRDAVEAYDRALNRCADELAALSQQLAAGDGDSALIPTLYELAQTNPTVCRCLDMHRHAQRTGYPFSLHSMLALLIAEMDRRHDKLEAMVLRGLSTAMPPLVIAPVAAPGGVDAWPARFFAGGPMGSFFTDSHQFAEQLIARYERNNVLSSRDDWTITDLASQERAP